MLRHMHCNVLEGCSHANEHGTVCDVELHSNIGTTNANTPNGPPPKKKMTALRHAFGLGQASASAAEDSHPSGPCNKHKSCRTFRDLQRGKQWRNN